jgi:hypothetical protein
MQRRPLDEAAGKVLSDLRRHGVAVTSAQELLRGKSVVAELQGRIFELERSKARIIAESRSAAADERMIGDKTFNLELLGRRPRLDPQSVYARFALQPSITSVVNAYFGMYARLRYYNVWHTLATEGRPRESQLWHRDREDQRILKVFVYHTDVDESAGPLTYATGSHRGGRNRTEPAYVVEGGVKRSTDEQMAAAVPPGQWLTAVGPAGTIVFADTNGYHKGGLARGRDRVMYTCMFTSRASQSKDLFELPVPAAPPADAAHRWALTGRA